MTLWEIIKRHGRQHSGNHRRHLKRGLASDRKYHTIDRGPFSAAHDGEVQGPLKLWASRQGKRRTGVHRSLSVLERPGISDRFSKNCRKQHDTRTDLVFSIMNTGEFIEIFVFLGNDDNTQTSELGIWIKKSALGAILEAVQSITLWAINRHS